MADQREQLIEKAAEAIYGALPAAVIVPWEDLRLAGRDEMRAKAREVLAVFEEANTPTDDELEALADVLDDCLQSLTDTRGICYPLADAALAAGFRRTVQGEKLGEHGGTIPLYGMLDVWMALYGTSHPEFDEFYAEHGYAESWARILDAVRERIVQGEPSDAAVIAALNAYDPRFPGEDLDDFQENEIADMRAALRAAAVSEGGERNV